MGEQLYARIGVWTGSHDEVDRWIEAACTDVKPRVAAQPGVRGALFLADREHGKALAITLWESEEARAASEAFRSQSQGRTTTSSGGSYETERYEVVDTLTV